MTEQQEVTTAEFAELTGIDVRTVRNMIYRKAIRARMARNDPTVKKGVIKIPLSEVGRVMKWIEKNSRPD